MHFCSSTNVAIFSKVTDQHILGTYKHFSQTFPSNGHTWCLRAIESMCSLSRAKLSFSEKSSVNFSKTWRSLRARQDQVLFNLEKKSILNFLNIPLYLTVKILTHRYIEALCKAEIMANSECRLLSSLSFLAILMK